MKVFLHPTPEMQPPDNGIGRVIHAQYKYLPQVGIELVSEENRAHVVALHVEKFDFPHVDVIHSHGMYWTGDKGRGDYGRGNDALNDLIVRSVRQSRALTVPSEWVAMPFKRDMRFTPDVIPHGIDTEEWTPPEAGKRGSYVLWNKNRAADVCDPMPPFLLAEKGLPIVSTFAPEGRFSAHMQLLGKMPSEQMKDVIRRAEIYLATTPETFGIGTLEAMACGVPILGYNWGGTAEIVRHKVDGYLVPPYDIEGLLTGYEWIRINRAELSDAARERAKQFSWLAACQKYAAVYQRLYDNVIPQAGTAVVITSYNYGRYLAEAIESVLRQTVPPQEIVVVDDGSSDETPRVAEQYSRYVRYIYQENQGVAAARNNGVRATASPFVICLDADDRLGDRYIEACEGALANDYGCGIAYTGLGFIYNGGVSDNRWTGDFNWEYQATAAVPPHTTIPTAAMFRRRMWERVGGYRQLFAPGEDAAFYTEGLAAGFTARKVSESPLIEYRDHGAGAHKSRPYVRIDGDKPWMRDGLYPMAAPAIQMPPVRSYIETLVTVVMPVGPTHEGYLPRAIHSVEGQDYRNWEVVLVNDTGAPLPADILAPFPYVRVVEMPANSGTGAARNAGALAARSPLILFLDADDELMPDAMSVMLAAFTTNEGRYIYSPWAHWDKDGVLKVEDVPAYDTFNAIASLLHASTVLIARSDVLNVRFDPTLPCLEDYDFFARCAIWGVHGRKIDDAMVIVDVQSGTRTRANAANRDKITTQIRARYQDYLEGKQMPGSCCGGGGDAIMAAKQRLSPSEFGINAYEAAQSAAPETKVRMRFTGDTVGAQSWNGLNGRVYRAGNNALERFIDADPADVITLRNTGAFVVVGPVTVKAEVDMNAPRPLPQQFAPLQVPVAEPQQVQAAQPQNGFTLPNDPLAMTASRGRVAPLPSAPPPYRLARSEPSESIPTFSGTPPLAPRPATVETFDYTRMGNGQPLTPPMMPQAQPLAPRPATVETFDYTRMGNGQPLTPPMTPQAQPLAPLASQPPVQRGEQATASLAPQGDGEISARDLLDFGTDFE